MERKMALWMKKKNLPLVGFEPTTIELDGLYPFPFKEKRLSIQEESLSLEKKDSLTKIGVKDKKWLN